MNGSDRTELQARLDQCTNALRHTEDRAVAGMDALELMHDLRGSLEALGHLTYLIQAEVNNPDKVLEYAALAEEQMQLMREMAMESLQFSVPTPKLTDLGEVAKIALKRHRHAYESKKVRLLHDLQQGVRADICSGRILRVLSNLLGNALDALPAGGTVRLSVRRGGGEAHLIVTDNGHGIPVENQARLFEPFFTTKMDRGTGLGLALSKRIVEEHRGRIRMRSCVHPGLSGTTFRVSIPA